MLRICQLNTQAVIEVGIVSLLVQLLQNDVFDIQEAAAAAIYNATTVGTNEQIKFLVDEGCIKPLCLENILKGGEAEKNQCNTDDVNVFAQMIDDAGGIQKIKDLQTDHDDRQIRVNAMRTLKKYWPEEATKSKFSMNYFSYARGHMIDDAGGLQKIKNLQTHDDSEICEIALTILVTHWQEEIDEYCLRVMRRYSFPYCFLLEPRSRPLPSLPRCGCDCGCEGVATDGGVAIDLKKVLVVDGGGETSRYMLSRFLSRIQRWRRPDIKVLSTELFHPRLLFYACYGNENEKS
ncbi:unnamed protein product [Fraxinus pennsylvanica]|uniref:Uncharacterized protein n=1 Tax=Fraxinus pennsylvanica TaxID=56036 RepID=A0AAD2A200_9LAMI|nr:unnamed protein product [Fraxinus pennsylvanica]